MPQYEDKASTILLHTEVCVVVWLTTELSLRVWSSGCRSRYQTLMGRMRFMKKPFCVLDLTVIVATVVTLCLNSRGGSGVFAASALRGLRFFQILRMLRMDDRHKFETYADALWWGIITLCTVGYGDRVPSSNFGKLIAAICSLIGISFFALPA
ncbi:unnamed protein product, partial [Didymodactylos carnosus]